MFWQKKQKTKNTPIPYASPTPAVPAPAAKPVSSVPPGQVELIRTDEPTAAVLMAIVSSRCGIPLERLQFIRIRLVEEYRP